ncbi:hypothetical protein TWF694_004610 [Orbilia ellipsospora]|uniref:F-box domain-containing protein n=1 Tax=Orbilia ellipsospora TaxID=2528407 RepID=A0AAV9WWS7_9PEZI
MMMATASPASFFSGWSATSFNATAAVFRALPANAQMGILSNVLSRNETLNAKSDTIMKVLGMLPPDVQKEVLSELPNFTDQLANCTTSLDAISCVLKNLPSSTQVKILSSLPVVKEYFAAGSITPEVQEEVLEKAKILSEQVASCKTNGELVTSILTSLPIEIQARILSNVPTVREHLGNSAIPATTQTEIIECLYALKDKLLDSPGSSLAAALYSESILAATSPLPLPAEIQMQILADLPTLKDQLNASQVCKYWRKLVFYCKQTRDARYVQATDEWKLHSLLGQRGIALGCRVQSGSVIQYLSAHMAGEQSPWVDISEYGFINEPAFELVNGTENDRKAVFLVKFSLDHTDSLIPLCELDFNIDRTVTIKSFLDAIAARAKVSLANREMDTNTPFRLRIRRSDAPSKKICFVGIIETNPKRTDRPDFHKYSTIEPRTRIQAARVTWRPTPAPAPAPAPVSRSSSPAPTGPAPRRRMPNGAAAAFFAQLEQNNQAPGASR